MCRCVSTVLCCIQALRETLFTLHEMQLRAQFRDTVAVNRLLLLPLHVALSDDTKMSFKLPLVNVWWNWIGWHQSETSKRVNDISLARTRPGAHSASHV